MGHIERRSSEDQDVIRRRQQRELDDPEGEAEYVVHTRAVDNSLWLKAGYYLDKYKILWYLAVATLIALGFDFKTPAANYKILSDRIDAVAKESQLAAEGRARLEQKVDVLITFRCMESNARDLQLAGIKCTYTPGVTNSPIAVPVPVPPAKEDK